MKTAASVRSTVVSLWILTAAALFSAPSHADLILDISGTPGSGETTWVFSGSTIATGTWSYGSAASQSFSPATDVVTSTINLVPASGSATFTINLDTRNFTNVGFFESGSSDNFILGTDGAFGSTVAGDAISWLGTLTLNTDIGNLAAGVYPDLALNLGTVDLTITSVPEPSTCLLLGFGLIALAARR